MAVGTVVRPERSLALLDQARANTDALFQLVREDALYERPIAERHRIIFYIGHLEAFDWNLIGQTTLHRDSPHEARNRLFAFGIDPVGGSLPSDQPSDWPALDEVREYCRATRRAVDDCLPHLSDDQLLHVAIEHRLMHAETLAYMLHQMPFDRKIAAGQEPAPPGRSLTRMMDIPAGSATLGLDPNSGFGWDNEFRRHTIHVPAFAIAAGNVTNGQFLEFMAAGGYQQEALWTPEAWNWIRAAEVEHPGFWVQREGEWRYRGMFAETPLPLDWPVYVSHAEASAYARWKGMALPSEAQYHRAASGAQASGNSGFRRWDPAPVGAYPASDSAFGVADLAGNGWEWTSTLFEPFEGFEPFPFYRGYSADFFDGKHYVMKGGSPRTAACLMRPSFRNWFQPHYPYVYATFRCVAN